MILQNASFENGWWHKDGIAELQLPNAWGDMWFLTGKQNPIAPEWEFVRPECRVLPKAQVPPEEHADFYWDGDYCIKWFKMWGAYQAGLTQTMELEPGIFDFSIGTYPDVYDAYNPKVPAGDPQTGMIRFVLLSEDGGEMKSAWVSMAPYLEKKRFGWRFATLGGVANVGFEIRMAHPVRNTGIFIDLAELNKVGGGGDECKHTDMPRTDYVRHAVVLPDYATLDQAHKVLDQVWPQRRSLFLASYDDALMGPGLTDKTAELLGKKVFDRKPEFDGFRDEHYPNCKLIYNPLPGEDPFDPDPKVRPDVAGWIGVHQLQHHPDGWGQFQLNGPPIVKTVSDIGRLIWAYNNTPIQWRHLLRLVFRRYHPEEGGVKFRYHPNKVEAGQNWIGYVCGDLTNELLAAGIPTEQVIVLGLNEVWEHNLENNQHSIDFDLAAIQAMVAWNMRYRTSFSYGASSMAVGNTWLPSEPGGEEQWKRILPLARMLRDYGGDLACFNYHSYGLMMVNNPNALWEFAPWLQERWVEMYDWLVANGVIVPFYHGEGGHVEGSVSAAADGVSVARDIQTLQASSAHYTIGIPHTDEVITLNKRKRLFMDAIEDDGDFGPNSAYSGMWLNPGQGWNGKISWTRAEAELIKYWDDRLEEINAERGYRASLGVTPFQAGNNSDWKGFDYAGAPLHSLAHRQFVRWRQGS